MANTKSITNANSIDNVAIPSDILIDNGVAISFADIAHLHASVLWRNVQIERVPSTKREVSKRAIRRYREARRISTGR